MCSMELILFCNIYGKIPGLESYSSKFTNSNLLKRTVFQEILQIFKEQLFFRILSADSFWMLTQQQFQILCIFKRSCVNLFQKKASMEFPKNSRKSFTCIKACFSSKESSNTNPLLFQVSLVSVVLQVAWNFNYKIKKLTINTGILSPVVCKSLISFHPHKVQKHSCEGVSVKRYS